MLQNLGLFLAAAGLSCAAPLFDGKTLNGWEVCNGKASYRVEGGAIVGRTVEGSPNSFLCTKKEYGDFVLEWESRNDPVLNSGVQIRSHRYSAEAAAEHKQPAGRVYGYQVEIADEKSGSSGGIYDEARRGWLDNIYKDPKASKAFRDNQWNKYKVEAIGDHIRVWLNGVPCADLVDPVDQTGFIALQVHAFKGEKPAEVRFRNIRIEDLGRHVWKPIFDGGTMNGWTPTGGGKWSVEDGALHAVSVDGDTRVGYLMSNDSYKDLTARVRVKIVKGNSGFFLRFNPEARQGYEMEIDEARRTGGFWRIAPQNGGWTTGPEDNAGVHAGEWNELTASLHGHRVVFHLNGVKTVDLPNDTIGPLEGKIGLQVHGRMPTEMWFKDVAVLVKEPAAAYPGARSEWRNFDRYDFELAGRKVTLVAPEKSAPGTPWLWRGEFFGAFPTVDEALLRQGWHVVYMACPNTFGSPDTMARWEQLYEELTGRYRFSKRPVLLGMSRGGLYVYNWAAAHPDRVGLIYGDAPVCDVKSWPGGRGKGKGSPEDWKLFQSVYGLTEEQALAWQQNPIDILAPIARAGIPILHVAGDADDVVPYEENTLVLKQRYEALGGHVELILKPGVGHHPHSLEDPAPIVEYILNHRLG